MRLSAQARLSQACVLLIACGLLLPGAALGRRAIPEDNLAYPVLLTLKDGTTGSGFYLSKDDATYLVTAKHVLFDSEKKKLRGESLEALSYSKDLTDRGRNLLFFDLGVLDSHGLIKLHATQDVVVVRIGNIVPVSEQDSQTLEQSKMGTPNLATDVPKPRAMAFVQGITARELTLAGIVGVDAADTVKTFDQVLIGNEVIMFGYPTSLALIPNPRLDFHRPLLRKGIVAGENPATRSIVLDCPSYKGDSGGPILEVEDEFPNRKFRVIGVMSEFVPFADVWKNEHFNYSNTTLQNSGYSVVTPMDFVLELIGKL